MRVDQSVSFFKNKVYCKIAIGGDGAVGKTTLCQRLARTIKEEEENLMTCGIDFHSLEVRDQKLIDVQLWDFGGQEHFRDFQGKLFDGAKIIILIYSVERMITFIKLEQWLDLIRQEKPLKVYLIGNKIDAPYRSVSKEEAMVYARVNKMHYFEVSAKYGNSFIEFENDLLRTLKTHL